MNIAWRGLAQMYFDNNDIKEACDTFKKALAVDSQDVEAMIQIGNCQYELQVTYFY